MTHRENGPVGRTFRLIRTKDTGNTGTGHIATGHTWPDGSVSLKWHTTGNSPANIGHYASVQNMLSIHGGPKALYFPYVPSTDVQYVDGDKPLSSQVTKSIGDVTWAIGNFAEKAEKGLNPDAAQLKKAFSELLDLVQR